MKKRGTLATGPGNPEDIPDTGRESRLFEGDLVNSSMIPETFGYRSLTENRERLDELAEYAAEELGMPFTGD